MRFEDLAFAAVIFAVFGWGIMGLYQGLTGVYNVPAMSEQEFKIDYSRIGEESGNLTKSQWDSLKVGANRLMESIPVVSEVWTGVKIIGGYLAMLGDMADMGMQMLEELIRVISVAVQLPDYVVRMIQLAVGIMVTWALYSAVMNRRG